MFEVKDVSGQEILQSILACQENEHPDEQLITAEGLFVTPLPPRIDVDQRYKKEWVESGKKSPSAWRSAWRLK